MNTFETEDENEIVCPRCFEKPPRKIPFKYEDFETHQIKCPCGAVYEVQIERPLYFVIREKEKNQ